MTRRRLLLIAPTADRTDVGEAWSTYQWVSGLAKRHEVTVLTYRKRGRPSLASQLPNARVVGWPETPLVGRFERFNSLLKPAYFHFAWRAERAIRQMLRNGERFDLAHQVAPLALRYPSPLRKFNIPYVIGPLAGSLDTPAPFQHEFGREPWYVRLREFDHWRIRHDPALRSTYARAAMVIGVAPYVHDLLTGLGIRSFTVLSETGVAETPAAIDRASPETRVRLLHVGRLVRSKGLRDAIRALGKLRDDPRWTFDIVGDGAERAPCEQLVRDLNIADRVTFHGRQPRDKVDAFYRQAHIFLFPSFREPSGNVVLEAMSFGCVPVVADRGGPAESVPPECGTRVDASDPETLAAGLASVLHHLFESPETINAKAEACRRRCDEVYHWPRKIERLEALYNELLTDHRPHQSGPSSPAPRQEMTHA